MKKIKLLIIMIFAPVLLSGCFLFDGPDDPVDEVIDPVKLQTPADLRINDAELQGKVYLFCDPVANASSYKFSINYDDTGFTVNSDTYSLDITERIGLPNQYSFTVKAIGDGVRYLDSDESTSISYDTTGNLTAPVLNVVNSTELTWNEVANADNYYIKAIDKENSNAITNIVSFTTAEATVNGRTYNFDSDIIEVRPYYFVIMATSTNDNYNDSLFSNEIVYTDHMVFTTPTNLTFNQNVNDLTLSWTADTYAEDFTVLIDGSTEVIVEGAESINLTGLISAGEHTFKVKSNKYGFFAQDSEYSVEENYTYNITLTTPTFDMVNRNGSDIEVSWNAILNAVNYTLVINSGTAYEQTITVSATGTSFPDTYANPDADDTFTFVITANGSGYYLNSNASESLFFNGIGELYAPTNVTLTGTVLSWNVVDYADRYEVALNNETVECYTNVGEPTGQIDLVGYMQPDSVYEIKIRTKSGVDYYDSEYTEGIMYNTSTNSRDNFTNRYFYYYGYHDYYITTQEELNDLVGYVCTYRLNSSNLYYGVIGKVFSEAYSDALDAYTETKPAIGHSYTSNGNERAISQTYYSSTNPNVEEVNAYPEQANALTDNLIYTEQDEGDKEADINNQLTNIEPHRFTSTRDNTYNDFASEKALVEVEVYNTDQLFMVIQSNAKPVFDAADVGSMQASATYEAIKDVLRDIIDDNMTDYEKVLVIHDWIMFNTNYDYIISTYDTITSYNKYVQPGYYYNIETDRDLTNSLDYGVFYLEGVFLDSFNHVAVCDGFAKAFSVMCEMEGIEAIKVNGTAGGGNHAWNKVYLSMDGGTTYNWYNVDITWGDANYSSGEVLTHEYFLITDSQISITHTEDTGYPAADVAHNYYDYYEYESGYDYYITTDIEIEHLVDYLIAEGINSLEIKYSGYTFDQIKSEIMSNLPGGTTMGPINLIEDSVIVIYWY